MSLRIVNAALRVLLGVVFLASGCLKLYPIEPFEFNFVAIGVANWTTAPFVARLLIGAELVLGVFLIFNVWLSRFTLPAVLAMLTVFTVYLVVQIITQGNEGNCGCFGTFLEMTPLESIVKNVMMAGVALWLLITKRQLTLPRLPNLLRERYVAWPLALAALALPFILNPVNATPPVVYDKSDVGYRLPLENLYANVPAKPAVDLRRGKRVLALLSLRCSHCKVAAAKMNVMHKRHPEIPFYYLIRGKADTRLKPFLTDTQHANIPYTIYNDDDFLYLAGGEVPSIFLLDNGVVVSRESLYSIEEARLLKWLQE